ESRMAKKKTAKPNDDEMSAFLASITEEQWQAIIQLLGLDKVEEFVEQEVELAKDVAEGLKWVQDQFNKERDRRHPERAKHRKWQQWKKDGLSYTGIVIKHKAETGEDVKRDAVIKALKRLKEEEET